MTTFFLVILNVDRLGHDPSRSWRKIFKLKIDGSVEDMIFFAVGIFKIYLITLHDSLIWMRYWIYSAYLCSLVFMSLAYYGRGGISFERWVWKLVLTKRRKVMTDSFPVWSTMIRNLFAQRSIARNVFGLVWFLFLSFFLYFFFVADLISQSFASLSLTSLRTDDSWTKR
jgi:hypothetical protein